VVHITSIAQLEGLLLLRECGIPMSVEAVARRLYCGPQAIASQLAALQAAGFLEQLAAPPGHFVYRPSSPDLGKQVDLLAQIYPQRRVAVTTLIYSDSTYAMRSFSDAFRIRKDT
jgi:hypothetical protein